MRVRPWHDRRAVGHGSGMIPTAPFGRTGHNSSRVIFGAAALFAMPRERARGLLTQLLGAGVNHIDVAASYGDAELRIGEWMGEHRSSFFLATKTGERDYAGVAASIDRSLERLQVDQLDMLQFHNLVDGPGWDAVFADGGGLAAAIEARAAGKLRFLGVTGHGTYAPAMHLKSLARFDFDAVLLPYNYALMKSATYARDFEALVAECARKEVAVQTIKSAARRRFREPPARRFSWYEPILDDEALVRCVQWVLGRPGLFLNTSSDARLLPRMLEAAAQTPRLPGDAAMAADLERLGIEPLFERDVADGVG